jgi:predicted transcriptional regulator
MTMGVGHGNQAVTIVAREGTNEPQVCWEKPKMAEAVLGLTARVVPGYVSNNRLSGEQLPELTQAVYKSLSTVETALAAAEARIAPKVEVKKSVFADHLVCLA